MVAGVFDELAQRRPRRRFTIGINDDVSGTSLPYDPSVDIEPPDTVRAIFFGLGSDGTVGANKNTIKILGSEEGLFAQGYFVYDSKKSGSQTISHLRFGPRPIRAPYLVPAGELRRLPPVRDARPGRRPRPRGRRRDAAPELPAPARQGVGLAVPPGTGADRRTSGIDAVRDRRRPDRPRGRPARDGSTSSCRRASSRSRACCRASRRSSGSRQPSTRRTAGAAPRSSSATRRRSTGRSTGLHRIEVPEAVTASRELPARRARRTRPSSSARSPARCWPVGAMTSRSARSRSTAPTRAARRPTRSATSPSWWRSGTRIPASSAATAASCARTA